MSIDIKNDQPFKGMPNSYHIIWCDPDENFYEIRLGNAHVKLGKSIYEKLLLHPKLTELHGEMYDHITIDEFAKLSEEQVAHLVSLGVNLISNNKSDKKAKVRHKVPYWANDWRKN